MSTSGMSRLTRTRLYEQVAEQITTWIQSNGLTAGDRLPPERELAQRECSPAGKCSMPFERLRRAK